jgi:hypothetical protein
LDQWSLVVAVNNDRVFETTLLASPSVDRRCQVIPKRGFSSTGSAYNSGLAEAQNEIVAFAHQDIFFPRHWTEQIQRAVTRLETQDPNWGVLGLVGVSRDTQDVRGYCYSTGLQRFVGKPFENVVEVRSLDEIVLIVRRSSGLTFDSNLPDFHLYGTDICLEAEKRGLKCYAASAFCIHNTNGIKSFPPGFWRSYFYLRRKWWDRLPVQTCCTTITKSGFPAYERMFEDWAHRVLRPRQVGSRWEDVESLRKFVEQQQSKWESV